MRLSKPFRKKLAKKPPPMQAAILACIRQLREDHRHPGLHVHAVGGTGVLEARVDGGNRLTFFWQSGRMMFESHCNHDLLKHRS
jgi:hypothetical protein